MSAEDITKKMKEIQGRIGSTNAFAYRNIGRVSSLFLSDTNQLHQMYGKFVGKAKAEHPDYFNEIASLDNQIIEYFQLLLKAVERTPEVCFSLINLASGKISELISFVSTLEAMPPEEKVSRLDYDKLLRERNELKNTVEIMVQYKGLPELNTLMETAKNNSLPLDEYWVLALCSSNLIEAVVNKKLEQLGEKAEGNFEDRYKKLCKVIKEKEGRDISQLLPSAVYKVRNKLDHSSESNTVTPKEAREISKVVTDFMNEVFTSKV